MKDIIEKMNGLSDQKFEIIIALLKYQRYLASNRGEEINLSVMSEYTKMFYEIIGALEN